LQPRHKKGGGDETREVKMRKKGGGDETREVKMRKKGGGDEGGPGI
jgi:hypothetical protein